MVPKAKGINLDFDALAETMRRLKERLLTDGVPSFSEDAMVKASRGKGDARPGLPGSLRSFLIAGGVLQA